MLQRQNRQEAATAAIAATSHALCIYLTAPQILTALVAFQCLQMVVVVDAV